MILRQGVQGSYIVLDGWERHKERAAIRDWCLEQGMVIDVPIDHQEQIVVRFANREDAMLCYLTLKS